MLATRRTTPRPAWIPLFEKHAEASADLRDPQSKTTRNFAWTLDFATAVVVKDVQDHTSDVLEALQAASDVICSCDPRLGVFLAFAELDAKIFRGRLKEAVFLQWKRLGDRTPGRTCIPDAANPRITIQLNDTLCHGPRPQLVLALLHQMVHTYFLICCAPPKEGLGIDGRLEHGRHFCAILYSISHCLSRRSYQSIPNRLAYGAATRRNPRRRRHPFESRGIRRLRRTMSAESIAVSNKFSTCSSSLQLDFAPEETFRWYEEECADIDVSRANTVYAMTESGPDPTPRMKAGNGAEFVEFVWDGKAFKLPRKRVESFETLKRTMAINKSRELKIPAVSENTFTSLFNFVKTGLYGPELLKVQNSQPWDSTIQTTSGPPEIRGTRKDWPEFLEIDIEAYKVAACLGFAEMARHAIKRLYAQHFTHNDPTDALEAIYDSEDPYEELRNFAVAFMARRLSPATASPSERFNMDILDRNLRNSGGLHDLYRRNLCFQEDVARARSKTRQPVQATPLPTFPVSTEPPWRDTISMMSRSWNEAPAIGYPDSTARMSTVASPPRPPLPPQMPPFSYGSHRSPYDTSFSMFGEPAEPPWMERNGYWEGCF